MQIESTESWFIICKTIDKSKICKLALSSLEVRSLLEIIQLWQSSTVKYLNLFRLRASKSDMGSIFIAKDFVENKSEENLNLYTTEKYKSI